MFATIEPRLIALLNDASSEPFTPSPSLELPPLQDPNILKASGCPLLLEPDASNGKPARNTGPQHASTLSSTIEEDELQRAASNLNQKTIKPAATTDRALGLSSPQSLRKILGEDIGASTTPTSKKRLAENAKDDFVQLPQPPKKHKAAKQVVPPIIIGLFEPPPQAALFPPIASSAFHDSHGRNTLNTIPINVKGVGELPKATIPTELDEKDVGTKANKTKKDIRTRKRWTEEETNNLLLGVHKHGLGSWTDILEDPAFSFNGRSGSDLKDRFRTCCPAELCGESAAPKAPLNPGDADAGWKQLQSAKPKSGLMSENILISTDDVLDGSGTYEAASTKTRKTRTHRRKVEDLAQLGIQGPFRKSHRRERRPFSEQEDHEILQGYRIHGPAWTRIQRDPRFNLHSRQPTDLRDRFRNKFPEKFRVDAKGGLLGRLNFNAGTGKLNAAVHSAEKKGKENADPNLSETGFQISLPSSQLANTSSEREKDGEKAGLPGLCSTSNISGSSSREGLRIQEIISSQDEISKSMPLHSQASLFGFKDHFGPFPEAPVIESVDSLPFTQSFDWGGSMTAPFTGSIGEMDISRLLLDEDWIENTNSNGREKNGLTDLSSNVTSVADQPNGPFYNLLCDPEQLVDIQESPF